jgi:hypothetical protein
MTTASARLLRAAVGFALVPPDEPERERDKLCPDCARLPAPPDGSDWSDDDSARS